MDWQPMETAPKDGSVIWLRNKCMDEPVKARWGRIYTEWREDPYLNWSSLFTETEDGLGFPGGRLVAPDEWAPFDE